MKKRLIAEIIQNDEVMMTIDDNLLSAEFGALDRGSLTDVVDWGIYVNRGSLSFIDNSGYFNNSNVNSPEIKNAKIRFYLTKNTTELIATFGVADCKFDDETRKVDINIQGNLLSWQNKYTTNYIWYNSLASLPRVTNDVALSANIEIRKTPLDATMGLLYIPNKSNLWNVMTKVCQVGMHRIYEDADGTPIFSTQFVEKTPIVVDINNIIAFENANYISIPNAEISSINRTGKLTQKTIDSTITNVDVFGVYQTDAFKQDTSFSITFSDWQTLLNIKYVTATITKEYSLPFKIFNPVIGVFGMVDDIVAGTTTPKTITITSSNIIVSEDREKAKISFTFRFREQATDLSSPIGALLYDKTVKNIQFYIKAEYFYDNGDYNYNYETIDNNETQKISSNDFLTDISNVNGTKLPIYILSEVSKKYSKGIECVECECLFNDYYDVDGNLVLDGSQLQHFEKYDIVIPYTVRRGQRVPFRINADGTPKHFRIIGIQYSYDGLLRQKLWLQEEQYNDIA